MLAKIIDIQYTGSVATVVLNTETDIQYVYAEPRLLSIAIEDAFGDDWQNATIDANLEGSLLMDFEPVFREN